MIARYSGHRARRCPHHFRRLNPADDEAWYREIGRWIEEPEARASYQPGIRQSFAHPDREHAPAQFFDAVAGRLGTR